MNKQIKMKNIKKSFNGSCIKTYNKKLDGYFPKINTTINKIDKFNITDYENLKEVKERVYNYYKESYISNDQIIKPIKNIDTGLKIEVWRSSINETFGNANYYKNLSLQNKKIKLATMDFLAKMIKYGNVRAKYYYLEHPIIIDGKQYMVNIDIKKVPGTNGRFYIHSINTKKIGTTGNSIMSRPLTVPTYEIIYHNQLPKSIAVPPKYSMLKNKNNIQETSKSK